MSERGRVGPVARALGCAGLLPQMAGVVLILLGRRDGGDPAGVLAFGGYALVILYGGLILSFLGGIWWSHAMRRACGQVPLAFAAVAPSLIAFGVAAGALGDAPGLPVPWFAVVLGSAILMTLPVDRHLARTGEAPEGWMVLRIPLSLGLGGLTILAGVLAGA